MDLSKLILLSSNENKIKEFNRFGLPVKAIKGRDLEEVQGTPLEVITYKALEVDEYCIVEDTILEIAGEEIVDIKGKIAIIEDLNYFGQSAKWIVSIGVIIEDKLYVSKGVIEGIMGMPIKDSNKGFGFDPYFYPTSNNPDFLSLSKLEEKGLKDSCSARKACIDSFLKNDDNLKIIETKDIPKWTGEYQKV
jgi:inosine/xanthosine triphosphate pyrophosphatase family protein